MAFAMAAALRAKNIAETEIGRHRRRRGKRLWVVFEDSIKNREIFDIPLPDFPWRPAWRARSHTPAE